MVIDVYIIGNSVIIIIHIDVIAISIPIKINPLGGITGKFIDGVTVTISVIIKIDNITYTISIKV